MNEPMNELKRLLEYNRWANLRILDAAAALAEAELRREIASSFPSVLATLVHAMGAEWIWLERWKGTSPTALPGSDGLDSVAAVRSRWDEVWAEQQAFLAGLGSGDAGRAVHYRLLSGEPDSRPLGELVRHVVNHATYHRGQLVTMLRQLGRTPPSTDYVRWLREVG
jgi:uncharacterized damage-inducible protein DinB